ncbi:ferric reductase-like transmembrane domain-containing protein [Pseudonocardia sp. GCM10023141]|uniref:ferredoxin reductase family protein n=1 Tax=Pseudonocardia sp. GCM10023141 TaxID=3252653 RepID=UPI00360E1EC3
MSEVRIESMMDRERSVRRMYLSALGVVIAGPALLWLAVAPPGPLWHRLSVISGLLALSAMVCAAILPSRLRSLNRAFGIETVIEVHRFLGVSTAVLTLAHLACVVAADPANVALLNVASAPARAVAAVSATVALVALVVTSVLRRRLRLPYEVWRGIHVLLGAVVIVASAVHVWLLDHIVRTTVMQVAVVVLLALVAGVGVYRWVWRALLDPSTEFVVHEVRPESPSVSTLVLEPRGGRHAGLDSWAFAPGQFAWIRLERTLTAEEHPFSIASSAHLGLTEFTVRHNGDFTRTLRSLPPGSPVWVDGPHGAFTSDIGSCEGLVMIAGGVGVTPMMSMLRTAADRGDRRPYRLVVVASAPDDLLFREELGFLQSTLDLVVTEVLRRPHEGWHGHTGDLGVSLMSVVLRTVPDPGDLDYFLCGPPALVDSALDVLDVLDVAATRIHTELFDFV